MMEKSIIIGLLQNTAILLSFAMLYENRWIKNEESKNLISKIFTGVVLGGIGIALMFTPWILVPGISFDTRSVMLSVAGLFFGAIPTLIAMVMTAILRFSMGGDGIWMGLAVIITSGSIGLLWRTYRPSWRNKKYHLELLAMGLLVHAVMLACTLLLPPEISFQTFKTLIIPLLFIYSPATMLLGMIMLKQSENWQNRLVQLKLQESESRLNQILESGNIVSLILDKDGNVNFCNNYLLEITGYSLSEIVGKNWFDFVVPGILKTKYFQMFSVAILAENVIKNSEYQIFNKNGDFVHISWYNILLRSDSNEVLGIASIGVNISDIRRYERKLEEKNAEIEQQNQEYKKLNIELLIEKKHSEEGENLKSAFLNNISHEIRTPFNGLLGFLSIIQNTDTTDSERDKYIDVINKSAYRLMNTIDDIVEFSQIQTGQIELKVSEVNIKGLIDNLFWRHIREIESKELKFIIHNDLPADLVYISTDSRKLDSIISNLIGNAIKFTNAGSIEFGIQLVDGDFRDGECGDNAGGDNAGGDNACIVSTNAEMLFYVKDTGVGIPKNKQWLIFERFMQVDGSSTRPYEGSGLGLPIAKAYIEMLGGKIWVESDPSENQDSGSSFYFTVPYKPILEETAIIESSVSEIDAEGNIYTTGDGLKILIVEDNEASEQLLEIAIRKFSKEILKASTGIEAVEVCLNNPDIDLILMDIKMPEMDGYEATRQIRQFNKDVVIIAQTAFALIGDREKSLEVGCNEYITKPIKKDELSNMINRLFFLTD